MDEAIKEFIAAADALRERWLNDGHELARKWADEFRAARNRYDAARDKIKGME